MFAGKIRTNPAERAPWVGRCRRVAVASLLVAWVVGLASTVANGQSPEQERRRQFVQGLLQQLIDSQMNRPQPQPQPGHTAPVQPGQAAPVQPGHPGHGSPHGSPHGSRHGGHGSSIRREVIQEITEFSSEAGNLIVSLQNDATKFGGVRPLISQAIEMQATAAVLKEKASRGHTPEMFRDDFVLLNQQWRILAYRVQQTYGVGETSLKYVQHMDGHDKRLRALLQVEPQMDRQQLLKVITLLSVELKNLLDELGLHVAHGTQRQTLLLEARKLQQQAGLISTSVQQGAQYDVVLAQYKQFLAHWGPFATSISGMQVEHVERSVRHIWEVDRSVHELLWIPYQVNSIQLLHISAVLQRQINQLFRDVTLYELIDLPNADRALPTAGEFFGLCEFFVVSVKEKEKPPVLVQAYLDIDEAWPRFSQIFVRLEEPETQRALKEIEQSLLTIRDSLGVRPPIDHEAVAERCAKLEHLSEYLNRSLKVYLARPGRYRRDFVATTLQQSAPFHEKCKVLNQQVAAGGSPQQLSREVAETAALWNNLYRSTQQVLQPERTYVDRITTQITPALVELQTLLVPQ